jgi:alpha/beta superfamily hydrolase
VTVAVRSTWRLGLAVAGVGVALVVGLDGSWFWCLVRILALGATVSCLMVVVHRGTLRAGAIAALAAGLVAVPAGGAIGYPYLTKGGSPVRTAGGLLALAGGLVLLMVGAVVLVRSARGWRRLLAVPIGLVLVYGLGFPIVVAVAATNVPRAALGEDTPATLGLEYVHVAFRATDGVRLSGWYVPSDNRAAVIVLHGASSTRSTVLGQAAVLARHGYGVLLFDGRGAGRSGGRSMNFGWYGERDVAAALDWLQGRSDVDPARIGAFGASMGGEVAIGALGADKRLRAVVAEGATNRVAGDWSWLADSYGMRGRLQQTVNRVTYAVTDLLTAAHPPATLRASVLRAAPRPVLLIAAGDVPDEATAGESIRSAAPGSVAVWVAEGADHTGALRSQPAEWERRVIEFFDGVLSAASPGARV